MNCSFCHIMVDPLYRPGISPIQDASILGALDDVPEFYGNSMFVLDPSGLRRGPYTDSTAPHDAVRNLLRALRAAGAGRLAIGTRQGGNEQP